MSRVANLFKEIKGDLPVKSAKGFIKQYLYSPGFRVLLNHRIGKFFFTSRFFLFRQIGAHYRMRLITKRGCDISYNAILCQNIKFPHAIGIVIGDGVVIKNNVKIFQQVTLGSHGKKNEKLSYPVIENNVIIFSGAKIIGGVSIGANAIIGANSVVNIDVPTGATAVGIPCKIRIR